MTRATYNYNDPGNQCTHCGAYEIRERTQEEFDKLQMADKVRANHDRLRMPYFQVRSHKVVDEHGSWSHCTLCDRWFL